MIFKEAICGISRLYVPFESVATSVFLIKSQSGYILIDCATTEDDVNNYIMPAITEVGVDIGDIKYILLTHLHADHAGGLDYICNSIPHIKVGMSVLAAGRMSKKHHEREYIGFCDGDVVDGILKVMHLPGHTDDAAGFLHLPTMTLISGDCVQQYGIEKYGCGLEYPSLYRKTLERLIKDKSIENILPSHEYTPVGSESRGREAYEAHIETCIEYDNLAKEFVAECLKDGIKDSHEISRLFKETYAELLPGILMLPHYTVQKYIDNR